MSQRRVTDDYLLVCIAFADFRAFIKMIKILNAELHSVC